MAEKFRFIGKRNSLVVLKIHFFYFDFKTRQNPLTIFLKIVSKFTKN